ncbi:hypothetical protein DFO83_101308 [Idiomarina loihiensis]|uniref:hypothetical protein n=1 Tax=Idiomarina TaxID=135575 RepID=UPI000D98ECC3|nr:MULTISPECIES: hypothetical protein [Idiomarina]PWW41616.1 hypothetical protein DFO83_101308 [Idiomarina loihiensis]TDP50674.1 hypothetical protein DET58_101308 [Idiomarina loihiensis]TDS25048.1 hypothetical protein DET62_101131 [Idiomarina sp. H2]
MKYIGSGLWAVAAAFLEVSGFGFSALIFGVVGLLIAMLGSSSAVFKLNYKTKDGE